VSVVYTSNRGNALFSERISPRKRHKEMDYQEVQIIARFLEGCIRQWWPWARDVEQIALDTIFKATNRRYSPQDASSWMAFLEAMRKKNPPADAIRVMRLLKQIAHGSAVDEYRKTWRSINNQPIEAIVERHQSTVRVWTEIESEVVLAAVKEICGEAILEVFVLRYCIDEETRDEKGPKKRSYREIAQILNDSNENPTTKPVTATTLRKRISRAREQLIEAGVWEYLCGQ
jgi:hypothetical protein